MLLKRCSLKVSQVKLTVNFTNCETSAIAGIHPTIISESFLRASAKAVEYLTDISTPVDLKDKGSLLRAASTSLNSKVCHTLN